MKITKSTVVSLDYTLRDPSGKLIDQSSDDEPLVYLHGHGQIVRGLERALEGREAGETVKVTVEPKDGYGDKSGREPVAVPREELPEDLDPEPGTPLRAQDPNGRWVTLWIVGVKDDNVLMSPEHPLAGVTLNFEVKLREVRDATADELKHGHVHGPGGAHH